MNATIAGNYGANSVSLVVKYVLFDNVHTSCHDYAANEVIKAM